MNTGTMPKAMYQGVLLAESDNVELVEGNVYFPPDSVRMEYLKKSDTPYTCPWKGECQYFDVVVDGDTASDAAFSYPDPKPAAENIKGYVAFWRGVEVSS